MSHELQETHEVTPVSRNEIKVQIPVTLAFHIGTLMTVTTPYEKREEEEINRRLDLVHKFDQHTEDMFSVDPTTLVPVTISPAELEVIIMSAITLSPGPDGEQSGARDFRDDHLRAARSLQRSFRLCGGKVDPEMTALLEAALH